VAFFVILHEIKKTRTATADNEDSGRQERRRRTTTMDGHDSGWQGQWRLSLSPDGATEPWSICGEKSTTV